MLGKLINPLTISIAAFFPLFAWQGGLAGLNAQLHSSANSLPRRAEVTRGPVTGPMAGSLTSSEVAAVAQMPTVPDSGSAAGLAWAPPPSALEPGTGSSAASPTVGSDFCVPGELCDGPATKEAALPAALVGGAAPTSLLPADQQLEMLKRQGATYLRLDQLGSAGEFHCYAELPLASAAGKFRSFRATGDRPELAVARVVAQVEAWSR